ncbi:tRNA (cytidine(34)-2'-O)-methyltransferase [Elongatibacter sediminis]|uniref:tRNA (cytidine(34)-2'-O)-methyltransferase n=1 Tax=Elongatibacter sediminis TaxID=3119006 RepID=A0AAW9R826_9GAMM
MLHVILHEPEIPPNTGNIIRLCANTGTQLHLIEPLGFALDDARLRRAGLDYREWARVEQHTDWRAFRRRYADLPLWAFSTRGTRTYVDAVFGPDDGLVFGPESRGLPTELLEEIGVDRTLRLPMQARSRSLNLSNTVAVSLYEALRQQAFGGLV